VSASLRASFALVVVAFFTASAFAQPVEAPARIAIHAEPILSFDPRQPERSRFGALEFRGGLTLTSPAKGFGGLSGLYVTPGGAGFVALSDKGNWFRGRLVYDGDRPSAIADAETAPILGNDGKPIVARGWYDTESLAEDDGAFYVGIERANRVLRFDFRKDGLRARGQPVDAPREILGLPNNRGLECLAAGPKNTALAGALVAISERGLDAGGNIKGFLIAGARPGSFSVKRHAEFDVSDCAFLPDGDLLLVQRQFSWLSGVAIRIVRVKQSDLKPEGLVDGAVLFEADLGYEIDNIEALAVHRDARGAVVLTLVSDDNFSMIQRTILLQFALVE
jgi:hypothetical protein